MKWWSKEISCSGSVLFRGSIPPRPTELAGLSDIGFEPDEITEGNGAHWILKLRSEQWGDAMMIAMRNPPRLPKELVAWAAELTDEERETALLGQASVSITLQGKKKNLFRDRKTLLRLLGGIMGDDGMVAIDHTSQRFWSRAALDDELVHDADVDIEALYCMHCVGDDKGKLAWVHTHGLAAIGLFDFDLIYPDESIAGIQRDSIRAVALAIAEEKLKINGQPIRISGASDQIQAIDASLFDRKASTSDRNARVSAHEDHIDNRAVICEPVGFLGRLFGKSAVPSRLFQREFDETKPLFFSDEASVLMASRAQGSLPVLQKIMAELEGIDLNFLAKIYYLTDGGGEFDREHMWFSIHSIDGDQIDATLVVNPFNIARMKNGDRGMHPVSQLTDWLIPTPTGNITPRDTSAMRRLRPHLGKIRESMAKETAENQ